MKKTTLKKVALLLVLTLAASALAGCAQQKDQTIYQEAGKQTVIKQQDALSTSTPTPSPTPETDTQQDTYDGYDPAAEEDDALTAMYAGGVYDEMGQSVYAGATPIPIDPIDMPTPTPRPDLVFNYGAYTADKLGLTFEAPNDWTLTADDTSVYTLTDPNIRDNINASISITITQTANNYKLGDVKNDLKSTLAEIQKSYTKWSVANADSRTLLGEDGYYNTYRGEEYDGTVVRGLVHIALLNGRTITIHLRAPGWFNTSYLKVYTRMRNTLKAL